MNNKYSKKLLLCLIAFLLFFNIVGSVQTAYAASSEGLLGALLSPTVPSSGNISGGGIKIIDTILSLLLDKILGPLLNIFTSDSNFTKQENSQHVSIKPLPAEEVYDSNSGGADALKGKIIVVDPGHGGSNPGAVANGTRESDNNLAVSIKLKEMLSKSGAKVIMTRDSDRMVDPNGTTLTEELAARVKIAERNNADIFVSVHSNYNSDSSIKGVMTFYHSDKSTDLARKVQKELVKEIKANDKGISTANFHVLRNTTMPGILVEIGFVSNSEEAKLLSDNSYRNKVAKGIFNGIVKYFDK